MNEKGRQGITVNAVGGNSAGLRSTLFELLVRCIAVLKAEV